MATPTPVDPTNQENLEEIARLRRERYEARQSGDEAR